MPINSSPFVRETLSGSVDARQSPARSCVKIMSLACDEVAITGFEAGAFKQARDFRDETRGVKRDFEIVVGAGAQTGDGAVGVL